MSFDDDIRDYGVYAVRPNRQLVKVDIKSVNDYYHGAYELHHFIPKSIRKLNKELYTRIEHMQKLFLLPKNIHSQVHGNSEKFDYHGFKWYDLLFSRRKWKEDYYESSCFDS